MIALYSRVSTVEQFKEGYSITEQQDRLKAYCDSRGWKGYKHFVDGGFSGAKLDRPALQEMIEGIYAGSIKKVIVFKLDRLSRSQKDTLELIEDVFIPNNVDFISITENLDTGSAFGRASIGLMACFAQLERENIKERLAVGREGRAKSGKWHGGCYAPIGYEYINDCLIVRDFEAMQVKECFNLFLQGKSMSDISKDFISRKWSQKWGEWTVSRVGATLRNPIYTGMIYHNGEKYQGLHEPLISEDDFNAVQKLIKKKYISKKTSKDALLLGKIYCAQCGARYAHKIAVYGKQRYHYYMCYSKYKVSPNMIKDPNCKNQNYTCCELDQIILDEMKKLTLEDLHEIPQKEDDKLTPLKKELAKVDKQRERLMDLYTIGDFSVEELQKKATPLNEKRDALKKQIAELTDEPKKPIEEMQKTILSIGDVIDHGNFDDIKQLIDDLIVKVEIDGEDIQIYWDFY